MSRAWSWSMAMTRPPASACVRRTSARRSTASLSTVCSHSPSGRQRGPQPLVGQRERERVVEGRLVHVAVRGAPLHLAAHAREVDGPHDAPVAQRVPVAVLVVGHGLLRLVAHERDGARVGAERRARQRQPARGVRERLAQRLAPGLLVARVVDLVEHHVGAARERPDRRRAHGHLLVGGHHAVHVGRQPAVAGRPGRVEVQPEAGRRCRPLDLEVGGGRHDHDLGGPLGERGAQGREREGRLAGAGRGHGQEVGVAARPRTGRGPRAARGGVGRNGTSAPGSGDGRADRLAHEERHERGDAAQRHLAEARAAATSAWSGRSRPRPARTAPRG